MEMKSPEHGVHWTSPEAVFNQGKFGYLEKGVCWTSPEEAAILYLAIIWALSLSDSLEEGGLPD